MRTCLLSSRPLPMQYARQSHPPTVSAMSVCTCVFVCVLICVCHTCAIRMSISSFDALSAMSVVEVALDLTLRAMPSCSTTALSICGTHTEHTRQARSNVVRVTQGRWLHKSGRGLLAGPVRDARLPVVCWQPHGFGQDQAGSKVYDQRTQLQNRALYTNPSGIASTLSERFSCTDALGTSTQMSPHMHHQVCILYVTPHSLPSCRGP